MNFKSNKRFFVFTLTLLTALAFFGVRPSQFHEDKMQVLLPSAPGSIHESTALPPVGIEGKEEQPSEEDDENLDTNDSADTQENSFVQKDLFSLINTNEVRSTSRGNFHCPLFIRINSIII